MIKLILKYIGIATAFAAGITLVIKVYSYLESIPERSKSYAEETQAVVRAYADTTFHLMNRIEGTLYQQGYRLDEISDRQGVLKNIVTTQAAKTMTPEQVLEMMQQFELKKNGSSFLPIVYVRDTFSIVLE